MHKMRLTPEIATTYFCNVRMFYYTPSSSFKKNTLKCFMMCPSSEKEKKRKHY